jgi:hypothetical protein
LTEIILKKNTKKNNFGKKRKKNTKKKYKGKAKTKFSTSSILKKLNSPKII